MKNSAPDDGFTDLCSLPLKAPHHELHLRLDPIVSSSRRRAAADYIDGGVDGSSSAGDTGPVDKIIVAISGPEKRRNEKRTLKP